MNHNTQNILNKIKKENIIPTSRFYFVLKHSVLWVPYVLVTTLGIVAFAGLLFGATHSGWEYREFVYRSDKDFIFASLPVIWIIAFSLFSILVVKALRTTHTGYRLSLKTMLFGSMMTSIVLGFVVYELDDFFKVDSLIRYPVHNREKIVWDAPAEGRIVGFLEEDEENDNNTILIRDMRGETWTIDISNFGTTTFPFIKLGEPVRFIGSSTGGNTFVACVVLPWEIGGVKRPNSPIGGFHKKFTRIVPTSACKEILKSLKGGPRMLQLNIN